MVQVIIVVREVGRQKPDYSLKFELPEVPKVGSYISIRRPDTPEPYSEDLIVREVWWRLHHPETRTMIAGDEPENAGRLVEIFVECDPAIGPYASDRWREMLQGALERGTVEEFPIERFSVRQRDLSK
jgi:hypothetical protein